MEELGFETFEVLEDRARIVSQLRGGVSTWFFSELEKALGRSLDETTRRLFDPATDEGLHNIFVKRREFSTYSDSISFVLQGNSKMGLSSMHQSWSRAGFGLFAHLNPGFALEIAMKVQERMAAARVTIDGPPHVIFKPPGGEALKPHVDGLSPRKLHQELTTHVTDGDGTTTSWAAKHGLQCLAHIAGGRSETDGATYTIGPMNPRRLLICMTAILDGKLSSMFADHGSFQKWTRQAEGPYFFPWLKALPQLNLVLAEHGEPPVRRILMTNEGSGGFAIAWPVGFPHGAFGTNKEKGSYRITTTVPLRSKRRDSSASPPRFVKRLRAMATLSDEDRRGEAEEWLRHDRVPYADGRTHKKPELVARWVRPGGAFESLAPTMDQVNELETKLNTDGGAEV